MSALSSDRARMHRSIALATGIPFAVLWGGWFVLTGSGGDTPAALAARAVAGVLAGALFGVVMSAVLGSRQWRAALAASTGGTIDAGTHAVRSLEVGQPAAEILRRAEEAAAVLGGAHVTSVDEATGTIELSCRCRGAAGGSGCGSSWPRRARPGRPR